METVPDGPPKSEAAPAPPPAKKQASPSPYVNSEPQHVTKPKEDTVVDDKKNVGFIPGLALILAALALVLISINAVKPTPTVEELEKAVDTKIAAVNDSILAIVKNGDIVTRKVNEALLLREIDDLKGSLDAVQTTAGDTALAAEFDAIAKQLSALMIKINPTAAAPAPTKEPVEEPKKAESK